MSIIVPTYNRSQFLAECLDGLLFQTLPPWQVIVVDDGCTDGTQDVLARYRDRVEVLRTPRQSGKATAVNLGLGRVTGDYVWIFDDDDVALPDALERLVEPLEADRALGFSFCPRLYAHTRPDGRIGVPTYESPMPDLAVSGQLPALMQHNFLGGAALFMRKSALDAVGPYDATLVRSQDFDMAIRMARRFRGAQAPGGGTFLYRQHEGPRGSAADRFEAGHQFAKWLEYDRVVVRRLRRDLRPGELLPPGRDPTASARLEQIACFGLMAGRLLHEEALRELQRLAEDHDDAPLDADERSAIRETSMRDPYYGVGSVYDDPAFTAAFARLASRHKVLRAVRRQVLLGLRRFVTMNGVAEARRRLPVALRRARSLFQDALEMEVGESSLQADAEGSSAGST
ncbi:MAG TPA: glycosyltransferase family 2 protein [Gemmatimonadales bacterium]|nr:glycosyltransferase family 2 protein [Gemmatimonadales bacterium]